MSPTITTARLQSLGLVFPVGSGDQYDLNVAFREGPDGTLTQISRCDHNCTTEVGGYDCPAASMAPENRGKKSSYAKAERILANMEIAREASVRANQILIDRYLDRYCYLMQIPAEVRDILIELLRSGGNEVNLFGGNPEMHPEIIWLIRELKKRGFRVNFTTTGRRFLTHPKFIEDFIVDPPHLLALSADDVDVQTLEGLLRMPLEDLYRVWLSIDPTHGQEQKFIEGIYTARLMKERGVKVVVLFNMVIHSGNIRNIRKIIRIMAKYLPGALMNAYPAQDSFGGGKGDIFSEADIREFGKLVDFFIRETLQKPSMFRRIWSRLTGDSKVTITKRLQYWLVMKAILEDCKGDPATASALIAGHGIWQCYRDDIGPIAGMYLQIGKSNPELVQIGGSEDDGPGGYLGCYWNNRTVTSPQQVHSVEQVVNHLLGGMQALARSAVSACPGCSMPRLWFDMIRTEAGLHPRIRVIYLRLRKQEVRF